jgi:SAM-dependent methyltransferase
VVKNKGVVKDQEHFFNINAQSEKVAIEGLFYDYVNKEQFEGFKWISDAKKILEYGCGTGTSLDIFFKGRKQDKYEVFGVDIAGEAIKEIKKAYPKYKFYKIKANKIPQIKNGALDAAFMLHVLHHSHDHQDIFNEISLKLKSGGKFFISDLASNNIFVRTGRSIFGLVSGLVRHKFKDDLVVDGKIPEKYKVDIPQTLKLLKKAGFKIEKVYYGHLFFFLFGWIDRFVPFSKSPMVEIIYRSIIKFEQWLLKFDLFKTQAEVFSIKCVKK